MISILKYLIVTSLLILAGIGLGLVLSPWFPQNFEYLLFHLLFKMFSPLGSAVPVGVEWYPYPFRWFLLFSIGAHLSLLSVLNRPGFVGG